VLGTADAEIVRLGVQHSVWRPHVFDAWRRAGVGLGATVIDIGCGPGFATLDLAAHVGPAGRVIAVERSGRFRAFLREQLTAHSVRNVSVVDIDLARDRIDVVDADAAWCRWVACFVTSPRTLVRSIATSLRRGGVAIFHEYVDYGTWRLLPDSPPLDAFVVETMASWRASAGEPDIARALPGLLQEEGCRIVDVRPLVFALTPRDDMWRWPAGYARAGAQRLRELGRVDDVWRDRVIADVDAAEQNPTTVMITPMVLEVIAERV